MKKRVMILLTVVLISTSITSFAMDIDAKGEIDVGQKVEPSSMYEVEPNDTPEQAERNNPIQANTQWRKGYLNPSYGDTVDYYYYYHSWDYDNIIVTVFDVARVQPVNLDVYYRDNNGNMNWVDGRENIGFQESLTMINRPKGDYFIKITLPRGVTMASYSIMVDTNRRN